MDDSQDQLKPHKHFKNGEWNKYVLAEGARIKLGSTATKCPTSWTRKSSRPTPRDSLACKFMESGKDQGRTALPATRQGSRNSFQVNRAVPQDHESPGPFDSFVGDRLPCDGQAPQKQGWIRILLQWQGLDRMENHRQLDSPEGRFSAHPTQARRKGMAATTTT